MCAIGCFIVCLLCTQMGSLKKGVFMYPRKITTLLLVVWCFIGSIAAMNDQIERDLRTCGRTLKQQVTQKDVLLVLKGLVHENSRIRMQAEFVIQAAFFAVFERVFIGSESVWIIGESNVYKIMQVLERACLSLERQAALGDPFWCVFFGALYYLPSRDPVIVFSALDLLARLPIITKTPWMIISQEPGLSDLFKVVSRLVDCASADAPTSVEEEAIALTTSWSRFQIEERAREKVVSKIEKCA